ncbi:MAG: hypothetical protein JNM31_12195 [Flavobacteriales bacterium]|nr:hypothetical protein [Flavobacteriales bacterium]
MDLQRRLKLYLFGLILGGILAWFFYGERLTNAEWTPAERIKLRLSNTLVKATPSALDSLQRWSLGVDELRARSREATVLMDKIQRKGDTLIYTVHYQLASGNYEAHVAVNRDHRADSTAVLLGITSR